MKAEFWSARETMLAVVILTMTVVSARCTPSRDAPEQSGVTQAVSGVFQKELATRWAAMKTKLLAVAEVMPASQYDYKPTPEVRSFGEILEHVTEANYRRMSEASGEQAPAAGEHGPGSKSKEEIVHMLSDSFDFGNRVLAALTPSRALETTASRNLGPMTRQNVIVQVLGNASEHYGQLVVYLRMNGIVPPRTAAREQ